ncbi:polyketide cyclase/dehydrase/lipid transport protein [Chitinophaga niastensis]|uniref:Polyketide cyclase/dehydrase/lipid transport protein n=1 Tax=Chitinophaga niastensis TaxID=536980 RepID=A0A2P8HSM4_CHINA|nr:GyrI-like domain-containing protein [Chitinophaga niastensis]PSL49231.1 polyketide cyclase/dehydrase/lipid transport protein [Chitinophaga niastensis]
MKVLKTLAWIIGIILLVVIVLVFAAPTRMHVERTVEINAPATIVWNDIVKFERFNEWSTWKKMDSAAKYTISGDDGTVGAIDAWQGDKIGKGQLQHLSLEPYKTVQQKLTFITPFSSESDVFFHLSEAAGKTKVTWSFDAHYKRPQNVMSFFMKGSLENDFEQGLSNLKSMAEAEMKGPGTPNGIDVTVKEMDFPATTYVAVRKTIPMSKISDYYHKNLRTIYQAATAAKLQPGVPCGIFFTWDKNLQQTDMAAAIPVPEGSKPAPGYEIITLPAAQAAYADYYGPYDKIANAHVAIHKFIAKKGKKIIPPTIEMYLTDPGTEKDSSKWLTKVIYFIK